MIDKNNKIMDMLANILDKVLVEFTKKYKEDK